MNQRVWKTQHELDQWSSSQMGKEDCYHLSSFSHFHNVYIKPKVSFIIKLNPWNLSGLLSRMLYSTCYIFNQSAILRILQFSIVIKLRKDPWIIIFLRSWFFSSPLYLAISENINHFISTHANTSRLSHPRKHWPAINNIPMLFEHLKNVYFKTTTPTKTQNVKGWV